MLVSITEFHNRLSYWLRKIPEQPVSITRRGKPVGVLMSAEAYQRLRAMQAYLEMLQISRALGDGDVTASGLYQASREDLTARQ